MPNTFTLSGTLNDGQNNPIINKYVRFRVTSVGTDTEDGAVYPRNSFDFKTDSSGDLQGESGSNTVWVNGDSGTQCYYEISLPDGQKVDVVLPSAVEGTTVSLDDIIENYQVDGGTQQSTTLASAKAYTDVLAADPTNNTSFTGAAPANWRSGLNVADGAQVNDPTTVLDADIGVTVQAYDATILNDADIGVTVQAYDATILNDADIGVTVQAYDATIVNDADIGVNVQAHDDGLDDISGLAVTDGNIIVGDGTNWVAESGNTARTSLGLGTGDTPEFNGIGVDDADITLSTSPLTTAISGFGSTIDLKIDGTTYFRVRQTSMGPIGVDLHMSTGQAVITDNLKVLNAASGLKVIDAFQTYAHFAVENGPGVAAPLGFATSTTSVTATTYTTLATDSVILVDDDTAAAEVTVTLLAAATAGDGFLLNIKKTGSTANVVIDGSGAETIDGATTNTLTTQYESVKLICDGTEWHII